MQKKLLLLSSLFLTSGALFAQITLVRSDFGQIGDTLEYDADTTFTPGQINLGSGGANKTWNLSTGVSADLSGPTIFADPVNYPGAPMGANLALESAVEGTQFFYVDSTQLKNIQDIQMVGAASFKIAQFPMTYNQSFADTNKVDFKTDGSMLGISGIDSLWIKVTIHNRNTVDAHGTLTIPKGNYNVLRVFQQISQDIEFLGKGPLTFGMWISLQKQTEKQYAYTFLAKNEKYYVARVLADSIGGVESVFYLAGAPANGVVETADSKGLMVYPNPASNQVFVTLPEGVNSAQVELRDLAGKVVLSNVASGNGAILHTAALAPGMYVCVAQGEQYSASSKIMITR